MFKVFIALCQCVKRGSAVCKHCRVYKRSSCGQCSGAVTVCRLGNDNRMTYFCSRCQTEDPTEIDIRWDFLSSEWLLTPCYSVTFHTHTHNAHVMLCGVTVNSPAWTRYWDGRVRDPCRTSTTLPQKRKKSGHVTFALWLTGQSSSSVKRVWVLDRWVSLRTIQKKNYTILSVT